MATQKRALPKSRPSELPVSVRVSDHLEQWGGQLHLEWQRGEPALAT